MPPTLAPCKPCSTACTCEAGSASLTTSFPLRDGNAPGRPSPLAWWQAAQLAVNSALPLAASTPSVTGTDPVTGALGAMLAPPATDAPAGDVLLTPGIAPPLPLLSVSGSAGCLRASR